MIFMEVHINNYVDVVESIQEYNQQQLLYKTWTQNLKFRNLKKKKK